MIGKAQIVPKPDDAGRGGMTGHRAIQLANRAMGPRLRCVATLSRPSSWNRHRLDRVEHLKRIVSV
jgi:hypothetical protein